MIAKVLIISYLFPPIGGGGVQRAVKMAKYLPDYGWEPHVLTVSEDAYFASKDASLLEQLPKSVVIHRAPQINLYPKHHDVKSASTGDVGAALPSKRAVLLRRFLKGIKNRLLIPDDQILWYHKAVKVGVEAIRQHNIQVIFSTSGPNTNHLIAYRLHKTAGIPWIADFRDPWTDNMHRSGIPWREWLESRMEAKVVTHANVITTVTDSFLSGFKNKYGAAIRKGAVIHNGYDVEDYRNIRSMEGNAVGMEGNTLPDVRKLSNKMRFAYTGIFYEKRNPRLFLQALRELIDEGKIQRQQIELHFAGIFDYPGHCANWQTVVELGLEDQVILHGQLPHGQALQLLAKADVQLLIADTDPSAGAYIPGKLFEYIAIGRPIFALSHQGETTNILNTLQIGKVADPTDKQEIKQQLLTLYTNWQELGSAVEIPDNIWERTKKYQRHEQARLLAEELNELLY